MKNNLLILLILCLSGCDIDLLEDQFELPWTNRTVVLTGSRTLSNSSADVEVEFDFIVLQAKTFSSLSGEYSSREAVEDIIQTYDAIDESNIEFNAWDDEDYTFSINTVVRSEAPGGSSQPISMGILLDISDPDSYGGFGFNNYYMEGLIGMIKMADPGQEFLIAKYRRRIANEPAYELITSQFEKYSEDLHIELSNLPLETRDAAPLYDAMWDMIDDVADKANYQERHLLVFNSSLDDGSVNNHTPDEIISKALANNVKISVVWRTSDGISDWRAVSKIPMITGGISAYDGASLTGGANTVLLKIFDILNGNLSYYTLNATVNDPNSLITNPFNYRNYFSVFAQEENIDGRGSSFYLNHPVIYHIE